MNAAEYLKSHGWRGAGFSLHENRGLAKPLLISQRTDQAGLGTKKNDFGDQWWTNAFDNSLKNLGTGERTASAVPSKIPVKLIGLYSKFVKAETLGATFTPPESDKELEDMSRTKSHARKDEARKGKLRNEEQASGANAVAVSSDGASVACGYVKVDESSELGELPKNKKRKHFEDEQSDKGSKELGDATGQAAMNKKSKKEKKWKQRDPDSNTAPKDAHQSEVAENVEIRGSLDAALKIRHKVTLCGDSTLTSGTTKSKKERKTSDTAPDAQNSSQNGTIVRRSTNEPHPESILALRRQGQFIALPGELGNEDSNSLRTQLVRLFERNEPLKIKKLLERRFPRPPPVQGERVPGEGPSRSSLKSAKIKRESARRAAKRDARHWLDVRHNPHLYRPDGTSVDSRDDHGKTGQKDKKKTKDKLEQWKSTAEEKKARRLLKDEMKVERRVARKLARAAKKRNNVESMQAQKAAKLKKEKVLKDQATAAELGLTYEAYIERERQKATKKTEDARVAKAEELGITMEEFMKQRQERLDSNEFAREAKELGLTIEEYANQLADELPEASVNPDALLTGMGETHGRSPIDALWAKHVKQTTKGDTSDSDSEDSSESSSSSDGESKSDSDSDSYDDGNDDNQVVKGRAKATSTSSGTHLTYPAKAGLDFIPLDFNMNNGDATERKMEKTKDRTETAPAFIIDTIGTTNSTPPAKKVKDMTKEERKARLETIRARRAARAGPSATSKKERRKLRAARKEELLKKMTNDLISAKKEMQGVKRGGDQERAVRKKARRSARSIMRRMKKGNVPEDEIMPGWEMKGRTLKKPKLRGNRSRENRL